MNRIEEINGRCLICREPKTNNHLCFIENVIENIKKHGMMSSEIDSKWLKESQVRIFLKELLQQISSLEKELELLKKVESATDEALKKLLEDNKSLELKLAEAQAKLLSISEYAKNNPGCGYTCGKMAESDTSELSKIKASYEAIIKKMRDSFEMVIKNDKTQYVYRHDDPSGKNSRRCSDLNWPPAGQRWNTPKEISEEALSLKSPTEELEMLRMKDLDYPFTTVSLERFDEKFYCLFRIPFTPYFLIFNRVSKLFLFARKIFESGWKWRLI